VSAPLLPRHASPRRPDARARHHRGWLGVGSLDRGGPRASSTDRLETDARLQPDCDGRGYEGNVHQPVHGETVASGLDRPLDWTFL